MTLRFATILAVIGVVGVVGSADSGVTAAQNPQSTASSSAPGATGTGQISGRVVDAMTGDPIDDAIVSLATSRAAGRSATVPRASSIDPTPSRVLVNGRGQFQFQHVPAGSVTVEAESDGYIQGGAGARTPEGAAVPIPLADGQSLTDVTIRLWKYAAIGGSVFDDNGDPVVGTSVRLLRRTAGDRRLVPEATTSTDDRGVFRFASLEPGRYLVVVPFSTSSIPASVADECRAQLSADVSPLRRGARAALPTPSEPGYRVGDTLLQPTSPLGRIAPPPTADGHVFVYRTTFYPGVAVPSQAQDVEVGAGDDQSGVDIRLSLMGALSVSGTIIFPRGSIDGVTLRLVPSDSSDVSDDEGLETAWTMPDAHGAFTFLGVPPGQYIIEWHDISIVPLPINASTTRVNPSDHSADGFFATLSREATWVRTTVSVGDAPVTGLTLTARADLRVSGQIRFAGSSSAVTSAELQRITPNLSPLNGNSSESVGAPLVGPDGHFSIDGCLPGRQMLGASWQAGASSPWTVASITAGGRDLLTQPLDLEGDVSDVIITFTDRPTQLSGAVQNSGRQDDPLEVLVFPADYKAAADAGMLVRRSRLTAADSGRFAVEGLSPGNYLVAAIPVSEADAWMEPVVLRAIAAQATAVSLPDRGRITVDVKPVVIR